MRLALVNKTLCSNSSLLVSTPIHTLIDKLIDTVRRRAFLACLVVGWSMSMYAPDRRSESAEPVQQTNWPCWRGPRGDGHSPASNPPTRWSATDNVVWKVALAGEGHASPILWNDHLFIASCISETGARILTALDRATGETRWHRTVIQSPLETKHGLNSFASSTPATDGKLVYVTFLESNNETILATNVSAPRDVTLGNIVVAAYDFDGQQRWIARAGQFVSVHGYCTCPVIYENLLILNGDHDGESFIVALDKKTGTEVWRIPRANKIRSYVTPIIREFAGRTQMILSGSNSVTSYDPRTGEPIWWMEGPTEQFVASMVDNGKYVFLTAGYPDKHILAIDPTGTGDISDTHIVWRSKKNCAYVPSPIVIDNYFLVTSDDGIASCYDANSGERLWFTRLGNHYSTSPVAAGGLAFFTADNGQTKIVRPGPTLDLVAENDIGETCSASAALSGASFYLRTSAHLFRTGQD